MDEFFDKPILNSPYDYPGRHWELDDVGPPTNRVLENRRRSALVTPVPRPRKHKRSKASRPELKLDETGGLSTEEQENYPTPIINEIRAHVDAWRRLAVKVINHLGDEVMKVFGV